MKSITLHNLEDDLYLKILSSAKKNRRSMNQEIIDKLINFFVPNSSEYNLSFRKYKGIWNEKDYEQFKHNTEDFDKINENDWA
ncbi:MAG: hypothetical protein ABSG15_12785 [FCB group bacterium]|jgi:hypothetical protein